MQNITLELEGRLIAGTTLPHANQSPRQEAVIFIHGWKSSQKGYIPRAEALTALGYDCLTFDLLGHGSSAGSLEEFSRKDHLSQCSLIYDYVKEDLEPGAIHIVAASYGGYLATLLSESRSIGRMALRAPALYRDEDFDLPTSQVREKQNLSEYRNIFHTPQENRVFAAAQKFTGEALLIESSEDTTILRPTLESYRAAFTAAHPLTYKIMQGVGHSLKTDEEKQAFLGILTGWFSPLPK